MYIQKQLVILILLSLFLWWFYFVTTSSHDILKKHLNSLVNEQKFNYFLNKENVTIDESSELTFYNNSEYSDNIIRMQRRLIKNTYTYAAHQNVIDINKLDELIPELGGTPIQSIILTTWRSGSTFLGDVLNALDYNFYHYEPLLHLGIVQVRDVDKSKSALTHINKLLHCNYTNMDDYIRYAKHSELLTQNTHYSKRCRYYCYIPQFLQESCRLYPFQSMKIVRLRLKYIEQFLNDDSLNVKVIYLIRDPRGIFQSRRSRPWCPKSADCSNRKIVCKDFIDDYYAAKKFSKLYPNKFGIVHYENLALKPYETIERIFKFYNRPFTNEIQSFLDRHTKINVNELKNLENTFRNSTITPFQWMRKLRLNYIRAIENDCKDAMNLWGYKMLPNTYNLSNKFQLNFYNINDTF